MIFLKPILATDFLIASSVGIVFILPSNFQILSIDAYEISKAPSVISEITDGAFDISYASMDKIWKFDGSMKTMPTEEAIKKSVAKIGYKNISAAEYIQLIHSFEKK